MLCLCNCMFDIILFISIGYMFCWCHCMFDITTVLDTIESGYMFLTSVYFTLILVHVFDINSSYGTYSLPRLLCISDHTLAGTSFGILVWSPYIFLIIKSLNWYSTRWLNSLSDLTSLAILPYHFMPSIDQPPNLMLVLLDFLWHINIIDILAIIQPCIPTPLNCEPAKCFIWYCTNIRKYCGTLLFLINLFYLYIYFKYLLI